MTQAILTKFVKAIAAASVLTAVTNIFTNIHPAQAYSIYFGEDLSTAIGNRVSPLPALPNASQAEADFLAGLSGVGTEDFENFTVGKRAPNTLTFPGVGTATLSGNGSVNSISSSASSGGVYPIFSDRNWLTYAGNGGLNLNFSQGVGALGFYLSDLELYKLVLDLTLTDGSNRQLLVDNSVLPDARSGSVLYYGLIAENQSELFTSVSLGFAGSGGDGVGLDNITIGSFEQKVSTPEPSSLLGLFAFGAVGAGSLLKRKLQKKASLSA